ncbi:phosphotransferase family protein [Rhodococcus ruber]|uniref:phosphotransferase family protein n=1 Tax=Rhodococcus ruber TaxID=1830 RepID=UPI0009ED86BE|nr:phosphotransferase [Rhodococcus ruber]AWH01477.1 hypothetical protein DCN13_24325 [Rhodococcus ruber]QRE79100.1 phosphotransferase [Rhodococcus ruber]
MSIAEQVHALGLWEGAELELDSSPTMASPSWWGADSERYSVRAAVDTRARVTGYVKVMEPHARGYVDLAASFEAATAAGDAGLGPAVYAADPESGLLVMEDFTGRSRTATLDRFGSAEAIAPLVELRKRVHSLAAFSRTASVFDDIRDALRVARAASAALPQDLPWMLRTLSDAEQRIEAAGYDLVPAHGDGNVSNVLVPEGGGLLLVDWDCAAMMDPLQDLGTLLGELCPHDRDARVVFEMFWRSWDYSLFDRARVYGIADSLRWALIGAYCDAMRPGTHEYSKFSDWQFLRARAGLRDPHFDDRIRNL